MKNTIIKKYIHHIAVFLILIFCGYFYYTKTNVSIQEKKSLLRIQKILNKKIEKLDLIVKELIKTGSITSFKELDKNGYIIIVYRGDSILNWSSNSIYIPSKYDTSFFNKKIKYLSNGWFYVNKYFFKDFKIIGLIKIKNEFPYTNKYLQNKFHDDFRINHDILISETFSKLNVFDNKGNFLFSIDLKNLSNKSILFAFPFILYVFFLIIIFCLINKLIDKQKKFFNRFILLFSFVTFIMLLRILQIFVRFPSFLYDFPLFNPAYFASSDLMPSLGDLFLNSLIIFFIVILLIKLIRNIHSRQNLVFLVFNILFVLYYFFLVYQIKILVLNSSISFELHKLVNLNVLTIIAFLIISIHLFVLMYILYYLLQVEHSFLNEIPLFIFLISCILGFVFFNLLHFKIDLIYVFFLIVIYIIVTVLKKILKPDSYTFLVFQLILFSILTVFVIYFYNDLKEKQNMQIVAENISYEHDPIAEYLFEELTIKINNDSTLRNYLFNLEVPYDEIYKYLRDNYFKGYWIKYNLQFYDCGPSDSVVFKIPDEFKVHCYEYFEKLIEKYGMHLPNSNFYYLKNKSGRINYLGYFTFNDDRKKTEMSIFIELETRQSIELPGYPSILLDENVRKDNYAQNYSYAKYKNGILISKFGNFSYSYHEDYFNCPENKMVFFTRIDNYSHLIFKSDNNTTIVVSKPLLSILDIVSSFSYVFLFYYIILLIIFLLYKLKTYKNLKFNIKSKIQISLILVLLISLIFTGCGILMFSIKQQERKNFEYLNEKIQSVYSELDNKFAFASNIDVNKFFSNDKGIDQFIYKLSEIFYTDINIYSTEGVLISTSRPEIFNRKLIGNMMNPEAYYEIVWNGKTELIHYENIGKLNYLSAYIPYINVRGKLLGFINLPYFIKEDIIKKEVINLFVTVSNIYVLLVLLTLFISTFLSNTITRNLKMLQERFSKIELLKKHELIDYKGNDEIAGLINEYNRMVVELQKNAELLAKTEREMAWREMAKQVAHEIKNPLTPMKLNIQFLNKAWIEKREDFHEILKKVTGTLIEQIDNLSKIASEFSNFAKMPQPINEKIDIEELLTKIMDLYSNQDIDLIIKIETYKPIYLFVDKEQMLRAFINIINNGIQSVTENQKPKIEIVVKRENGNISIYFADNGKGIPDELKDKLFVPNFTTKSSGMGLGLAITKNIIESSGGSISFVSEVNKGTTFIILLPEYI